MSKVVEKINKMNFPVLVTDNKGVQKYCKNTKEVFEFLTKHKL